MKPRTIIIFSISVIALLMTVGLITSPPKPQHSEPTEQPSAPGEQEETMACGKLSAYVISKGWVKQCVHDPSGVYFPNYEETFVQGDATGYYTIDGYYLREDGSRRDYKATLSCKMDHWEAGILIVNGVFATPGMAL
ncbi:MAG: hypothetical protein ABI432_15425 [Flavobacteriales bacterium]